MLDKRISVAILQDRPGSGIREAYMRRLEEYRPDILAFPEYYFVEQSDDSVLASCFRRDQVLEWLADISSKFGCTVIGGSVVEHIDGSFINRSYVLDRGAIIGHYDKIHPYDNEGRGLIRPGWEYKVFVIGHLRIGVLICADVLYSSSFANIRGLSPDIIFIPTTSPYRERENRDTKFARDQRIFALGASLAQSLVFKVCASGTIAGHRLQGRSLVASPGSIDWRVDPEFEMTSALILIDVNPELSSRKLDIRVYRD